jgi:hypothetical protein
LGERRHATPGDREARITKALNDAARAALLRHEREGHSIWIWRDGKVVEVPPEQIIVPPED